MKKVKKMGKLAGGLAATLAVMLGIFVAAFGLVFMPAQAAMAVSCPSGTARAGEDVSSLAECSISESSDTLMPTVAQIINVALGVLGFVAAVMIIMGGVSYTTSAGDAAKVAKAKNTIIYGVVGLVIALLAFAIVNFIIGNVFKGGTTTDGSGSTSTTMEACTKAGKTWDGTTNTCK